jgi:DNA-binding response OmpR family regulator
MASEEKVRIVIVEDDPKQRNLMQIVLGAEGFEVRVAANGEQGVAVARDILPSLVITDVMMPVMNGFELLRQLRSDPRTVNIPIIFVTALEGERHYRAGFSLGVDDYLTKPWERAVLISRVRAVLQRASTAAERRQQAAREAAGASVAEPAEPARQPPPEPEELQGPKLLLAGELATASVLEVLQTLGWRAVSGRLQVQGKNPAFAELEEGRLIRVEVRTPRKTLQGYKALLRLAIMTEGSFELWDYGPSPTQEWSAPPSGVFAQPLHNLLMEAAVHRDEFHRLRTMFPPQGLVMLRRGKLPPDASPLEREIWQKVEAPGLELDELLDELELTDLEILRVVARLMLDRVIGGRPVSAN